MNPPSPLPLLLQTPGWVPLFSSVHFVAEYKTLEDDMAALSSPLRLGNRSGEEKSDGCVP